MPNHENHLRAPAAVTAAPSQASQQTIHRSTKSTALRCLIAIRDKTASLTKVSRGPQLLRQLRDLPALPSCVADGQAQDVRAVGKHRDCQTVHVGPQLWLRGCRAAQLTLPVLICKPRSMHQGFKLCCAQTPLVARTESDRGVW